MVVCHDLGAPYFTVYVLSCGTEHERRATGVGEEEEEEGRRGSVGKSSYDTLNAWCESGGATDTLTVNCQR